MKRYLYGLAAVTVALAFAGCGSTTTNTPTHVVNVFLDGINSVDLRQACSATALQGKRMQDCETFYAGFIAQAAMFGVFGGYAVVPHHTKVWTQQYRGRSVELATVEFRYVPNKASRVVVARLRRVAGVWKIWHIG